MKTLNNVSSDRFFQSNFMQLYVRLRKASNWLLDEQAQIAKHNEVTVQPLYVMQVLREMEPKAATINQLIEMNTKLNGFATSLWNQNKYNNTHKLPKWTNSQTKNFCKKS